jgi:hypothetical protein
MTLPASLLDVRTRPHLEAQFSLRWWCWRLCRQSTCQQHQHQPKHRIAHMGPTRYRLNSKLVTTPKYSATAAKTPEEIGILRCGRANDTALRGHDVSGSQRVAGPPETSRQIAEAATEAEFCDAGRGYEPERRRQPVQLCLTVNVAEQTPRLDRSQSREMDPPIRRAAGTCRASGRHHR